MWNLLPHKLIFTYLLDFFLGETMLHLAAGCGTEKAGLFLVNNGANCSATNNKVSSQNIVLELSLCVLKIVAFV